MSDFIELGSITSCFGVKGWVKMYSHTRPRIGIANYSQFYYGDDKIPISFSVIKASGKYIIGQITDVNSRETADPFIGKALFIKRDELPQLNDEYYWHQLIGLSVINQHGDVLGKITEMMETGANDVMIIHDENKREILIPYVINHFVLSINIDQGEMQVEWEVDDSE